MKISRNTTPLQSTPALFIENTPAVEKRRDKRNKMDTSCCCYAKVLDDISKLKESQNIILEGVEKLLFAFNNRETFHDEERPKKKRRHFSNRCPESSLKEYVHKEVLQENYQKIVSGLDFSKGHVLDRLLQGDAISESDHEIILNLGQKRKDQNRYIIHRFRHYGTDRFETFLESLSEEYPDLRSDLKSTYQEKLETSGKRKCLFCTIVNTVDISDVLDPLFENKLVDDTIIERRLNYASLAQATLWSQLFDQLKKASSEDRCKELFVETLATKYKDIAESVESVDFQTLFGCLCRQQKNAPACGFQTDGSGSLSDVSSISTMDGRPISKNTVQDLQRVMSSHGFSLQREETESFGSISSHEKEISEEGSTSEKYKTFSSFKNQSITSPMDDAQFPSNNDAVKSNEQDEIQMNKEVKTTESLHLIREPLSQSGKPRSHGDNSKSIIPVPRPRNPKPNIPLNINNQLRSSEKETVSPVSIETVPGLLPESLNHSQTTKTNTSLRLSSSFQLPSRTDRRRYGISVQQAEQFINWTSQDDQNKSSDRRSYRYRTA